MADQVNYIFIGRSKVGFWYHDDFVGTISDADYEHISKKLVDGYVEGELCTSDPENQEVTHYGWWKVSKI